MAFKGKSDEVEGFTEADTLPVQANLQDLSWAELKATSEEAVQITELDELQQISDKSLLVDKEMVILTWRWGKSSFQGRDEFVAVVCRTEEGLFFFTDGSSGIALQLDRYEAKLRNNPQLQARFVQHGLYLPHGLRVSNYDHPEYGPAQTFYLNNAR